MSLPPGIHFPWFIYEIGLAVEDPDAPEKVQAVWCGIPQFRIIHDFLDFLGFGCGIDGETNYGDLGDGRNEISQDYEPGSVSVILEAHSEEVCLWWSQKRIAIKKV